MEGPGGDDNGHQSVVLEEEIDENYEPTEEEILEYAGWLEMDLEREKDLLWIASEGLKAPLPEDWKPCRSPEGDIYYFNFSTGESVWDHPCDEYYRKLYRDEKEKKKKKETAAAAAPTLEPSTSASVAKPAASTTKVFQAPQKLSSLEAIPGLRRKEDPLLKPALLGQQSPSKKEREYEEAAKDKRARDDFAKDLETERKLWEELQRAEVSKKKEKIMKDSLADLEAYREEAADSERKEKAEIDAKTEEYRQSLAELYRKEEDVLRKLQKQKTLTLEKELKKEEETKMEILEEELKVKVSEVQREHEAKVVALKSENEKVLKQLELDLDLVSKTCSQKIENLVKEKEEREASFAEEVATLESEHFARVESKKLELEGDFQVKIEEIKASHELTFKNQEMVQTTFAEEHKNLEETVRKKVDAEREKNQAFLEEEINRLKAEREETLEAEKAKHKKTLDEELSRLEKESKAKIKEAQDKNETFVDEELTSLRSTRAEKLAEDRFQQEDQFNQMVQDYEERHKEAERDAEKRLQEKFKELEQRHVAEIEAKEKQAKMESNLKIESLQKEFEAFEAECQQDMESKKAAMAQALSKELTDQVEERKRIALEALALEVEEFKTQERLKLLQRAKRDVEAEVDVEEDSAETESSEKVEIFEEKSDLKPTPQASISKLETLEAAGGSHNLLLEFLKEQKQFLQQRQRALHKAREDWKVHVKVLKERKDSGLPSTTGDDVALATAKYTLEVQSRMLNEDTRNYRLLKQEIEKSIMKASGAGGGKENDSYPYSMDAENYYPPSRSAKSRAKDDLKGRDDSRFESALHPARAYMKSMSSSRRSYEKVKHDRQHEDALHVLNGQSKWLNTFKTKLCSTLSNANQNKKVASALGRLRSSANREVIIRVGI